MAITLENLSKHELDLYEHVCSLSGTIEEKEAQISSDGIFEKYREIHRDYFDLFFLAKSDEIKLEALKRMIFLNWYSMVEPGFFTGIEELDDAIIFQSYSIVNDYLSTHKIDRELRWMLSYYCMFEWVILEFSEGKLSELTRFVKKSAHIPVINIPNPKTIKENMQNRGQMGLYFLSISQKY